jgi:hypothetical protein
MKFTSLGANSTAIGIKFIANQASCLYHDTSTNVKYRISIKTPLSRGCFYSTTSGSLVNSANCFVDSLDTYLSIDKNGKYTFNNLIDVHKALCNGSVIALGLSCEDFPYLAAIRMFKSGLCLLAVPIRGHEDIALNIITDDEWQDELEFIKIFS